MSALSQRLAVELPHIEAALHAATATLPAPAQPVAQHIFAAGGKRLRPFLTVLMARLLGYTGDDIYPLAVSMEMLHAATLLHDDVLDTAHTRRGKAAAHTIFGITPVILAGDALLAWANMQVAQHEDTRLCVCFAAATAHTAAGEILEIQYLRSIDQPASIYTTVIQGKTAWLLRASCAMGAIKAKASDAHVCAAEMYGENIGMAFQIVDDALDCAPTALTGKPTGGDLREGKLTPPVALYRASLSAAERAHFDAAFCAGTVSEAEAERIAEAIRTAGFDTRTRELAGEYIHKALTALDDLPQGDEHTLLRIMTDYIQKREK